MSLQEIKTFTRNNPNTYHQEAWQQHDTYIVWAEDMESGAVHGDNRKVKQILDVTIDVFTKDEYPKLSQDFKML